MMETAIEEREQPLRISALIACKREMALAKTADGQLRAMKIGLAPLAVPLRDGLIDKQIVVDEVFEHADAIGLRDKVGDAPIAHALEHALDPEADEPPLHPSIEPPWPNPADYGECQVLPKMGTNSTSPPSRSQSTNGSRAPW